MLKYVPACQSSISRNFHSTILLCKQPPHDQQRRRRKNIAPFHKFPTCVDDPLTNLKIDDIIAPKPEGSFGCTEPGLVKKFFKNSEVLKRLPSLYDKICELYYLEDNMWYHNLDLPLLFPETLDFAQHITRTNVQPISTLSLHANEMPSVSVSRCIQHVVEDELHRLNRPYRNPLEVSERAQNLRFSDRQNFLCSLMECVHTRLAHLYQSSHVMTDNNQIGCASKLETFFKRRGYADILEDHSKDDSILEGIWEPKSEIMVDADGLIRFRLRGELAWQLRGRNPLIPFISMDDITCFTNGLPTSLYHPEVYGLKVVEGYTFSCVPFTHNATSSEHIRTIAGHWSNTPFWAGDPCEFGLVGVLDVAKNEGLRFDLSRSTLLSETEKTSIINRHELSEGILAAFAWASAIAYNQGFSLYNELTYPIPVQLLLTDGRHFQLLCFQLNSLTALWKAEDAGLPFNMAWFSERMPLYNVAPDGKVYINAEVLALIESSLLRTPLSAHSDRTNLHPYLQPRNNLGQRLIPPSPTEVSAAEVDDSSGASLTDSEKKALLAVEGRESKTTNLRIKKHPRMHVNDIFFLRETQKADLIKEFREKMPIFGGPSLMLPEKPRRLLQEYENDLRRNSGHRKVLRGPRRWR